MANLSQKEIRQKTPWLLALLLLINFGLMAYDARDTETKERVVRVWFQTIASPFQTAASGVSNTGGGFFSNLAAWNSAVGENQSLKEKVAALEVQLQQTQGLNVENERLKGLLELRNQTSYKTVAASVIARDPSAWFNSVTINAGRASGVELNMPVVTADGVVGRVVATSPFTSQVLLLTDDKSAVGAIVGQIGQSNAFGSVRGTGKKSLLEMGYVSGQEQIELETIVMTTGQDKIYPAGLKVGTVAEANNAGSTTVPQKILLKPAAALDSLKEVSVLLYQPPPMPAPDQSLPNVTPATEKKRSRK